ncbi:MAG TPA: hypothetical protein VHV79_00035 [Mycobacteriales bacterium]|jgi:hypothetical protein|nr:hypothetical protein [Mycobacteriales bacterium]
MTTLLNRFRQLYGANPLHLLAFIASFALAGYAATELFHTMTIRVAVWFVGAALGHDLLLVPLYSLANISLAKIWQRVPRPESVPWLNYIRFPVAISALLLVIFFPEISRRRTAQFASSGLSNHPYFAHWLLITGILFAVSALTYAIRLRRVSGPSAPPS